VSGLERGPDREEDLPLPVALRADLERGLSADPEAIARVRGQVVAAFRTQPVVARGRPSVAGSRAPATLRWRGSLRRLTAVGLAGALLLGSVGLVAANSGPGDPFYGLRLAAEELNLLGPATHLDRLQQRLDEASRESDNAAAVTAALRAYRDELQRALADAKDEAGRRAILDRLNAHHVVLDALAGTVPDAAADGLEQALSQVGKAELDLKARNGSSPQASPSPKKTSPDKTAKPAPSRRPSPR
jgi:hypothetical protein